MVRLLPPNFDVRAVTLIPRNAGIGSDFFSLNLRVSRAFRITGTVRVEGLVEAFNLTEPCEHADSKRELRARRVPDEPGAHVQPDHRRRRSQKLPVRPAADVLRPGEVVRMNLLKWSLPIVLGVALVTPVVSGRAANSSTQIGVKDRANAYASIDARGQFAALTWGASTKAGATDIYVAVSRDGGRAFAPPTRVNGVAGDASLSGEQPPQIVLIPRTDRDPSIVVMWTSKAPAGTQASDRAFRRWRKVVCVVRSASQAAMRPATVVGNRLPQAAMAVSSPSGSIIANWLRVEAALAR